MKKKKKLAEGFGAIYKSKTKEVPPEYKGLKKSKGLKVMPKKEKKIKIPKRVLPNIRKGKRYYA